MANFETAGEVPGAGLSLDDRIAITARTLDVLSGQIVAGDRSGMPGPIFEGWSKGMSLATVELGLIQPSDVEGDVNVYMLRRKDNDPIPEWRRKRHIIGRVLMLGDERPDEDDFSGIVERVLDETEGGLTLLDRPIQCGSVIRRGHRGIELTTRLIARVSGVPTVGEFCRVGEMLTPPNDQELLETHANAIARVRTNAYRYGLA